MNTNFHQNDRYPLEQLPQDIQSFIQSVASSTNTPPELVAPVVLSAAAAAVQGVVDVKSPNGLVMPTSLFFGVTARSGDGKSSVLRMVTSAFEEFEQGLLISNKAEHLGESVESACSHPMLLEEASEAGVIDLLRQGAKSVFYSLDEGALLLRRMDIPALCKRFDGSTIRHLTRKEGAIVLADRRASVCMLVQDVTFARVMKQKGEIMVESGFLPRMLMSFSTKHFLQTVPNFLPPLYNQDPQNHSFHDTARHLLVEYGNSLRDPNFKRRQISLSSDAEFYWFGFSSEMTAALSQNPALEEIRSFIKRGPEHALRLAAVLQSFSSPRSQVEAWVMRAAIAVVRWHLWEVQMAFLAPPPFVLNMQLASKLHEFLLQRVRRTGQSSMSRSELIRCAPAELRNAERLDIAIQHLSHNNLVAETVKNRTRILTINSGVIFGRQNYY